ncbi:unnamed protein product [Musa acuminata subsp. burmannicoides]
MGIKRISPAHSPVHVTVLPYINLSVHVTKGFFDPSRLRGSKKTPWSLEGFSSDLTDELGLLGSDTILCGFSSSVTLPSGHIFLSFVFSWFF